MLRVQKVPLHGYDIRGRNFMGQLKL